MHYSTPLRGGLVVEGVPLGMGRQYTPRLTMKRVYNTKCFRPERYRHEVANHYRDFKLQQHLHPHIPSLAARRRRRRRHHLAPPPGEPPRVAASLASAYVRFRDVWPTHVQHIPRYGRAGQNRTRNPHPHPTPPPPEETYNDAVRRIRGAHSCAQLRQLVHRQLARLGIGIGLGNGYRAWTSSGSSSSDGGHTSRHTSRRRSHSSDRANYQLNINNSVEAEGDDGGAAEGAESLQEQVDFYGYLQLASGYYERGVQANIKYLESIGRQKQQQQQQHEQQQQQQLTEPCNAIKARAAADSFLDSTTKAIPGRLVTLLKSLRSKAVRSRRSSEPGIRVNIRAREQQQRDREIRAEEQLNEGQEKQPACDSMSEYYAQGYAKSSSSSATAAAAAAGTLGATSATLGVTVESKAVVLGAVATRTPTLNVNPNPNPNGAAGTEQRSVYEIIDNLSHLSLAEAGSRRQQLPQITLTDCTAQQVALYSASFDLIQLQAPHSSRPPTHRS
ncbi:hypothetical protein KR018_008953 [Drosophila ironensis]|nr:hypothetical protein KR018_008953 [Drosophila ironensis]